MRMFDCAEKLVLAYRAYCAENNIPCVYVVDVDRTALLHQSARYLAWEIAKEAYKNRDVEALTTGAKGFLDTIYNMIAVSETAGLVAFRKSVHEAGVKQEDIRRHASTVVKSTINEEFHYFLSDVQQAHIGSKEKPTILIKTTGLEEVAVCLEDILGKTRFWGTPVNSVFNIQALGNPYGGEELKLTEEDQVNILDKWLGENVLLDEGRKYGLRDTVVVDDRYMGFTEDTKPAFFVASNKAPEKIKNLADFVLG